MDDGQLTTLPPVADDSDRPMTLHAMFHELAHIWAGPRLWNSLPLHLGDSKPTVLGFRRLLKTHLLAENRGT